MREASSDAQFGLLGPLSVEHDRTEIRISAGQQRVVLAALLIWANRVVTVDRMADLLWGDALPPAAGVTVRGYVKRLRTALGPVLKDRVVTRAPGYLISVRDDEVDLFRFETMFGIGGEAIRAENWHRAFDVLSQAKDLWRGAPLEDIPSDMLRSEVTEPLTEKRMQALEWRAEAGLQLGLHADLVADLVLLCEQHSAREPFRGQLMRALYMCGRQGDALNTFQEARNWLVTELGVEPGPDLRRLHERILAHDPDLSFTPPTVSKPSATLARSAPAAPPLDGPPSAPLPPLGQSPAQLPADIAEFTGREEQVDRLCGFLSGNAGVVSPGAVPVALVAGMGGLGKTALAVHAAHKLARGFPDGQLYVDLLGGTPHPLAPGQVLARFLRSFGIDSAMVPTEQAEREALYRTRLAGRRMLILLDNARDSAQVRPLLPGSASSAVLITTRTRLPDLPSAKLLDLNVLEDAEARSLFTRVVGEERVKDEPAAVVDLLRSCGGFPLAIRICAARLAARPRWAIAMMSDKIRDSRRRLDELRTGDMAVRASFQVSFDSLPAEGDPACAFRRLGLWQGAFISPEAAAALLGRPQNETEEALENLVDACLLESPAPGQYRFHDLLRVYAAELAQADESAPDRDAALTRLLEWYLHSVDAAVTAIAPQRTRPPIPKVPPGLRPLVFTDVQEALDWLESERGNIVAATRQASDAGEDTMAWLLPAAALAFFNRRGYHSDSITTHQLALAGSQISEVRATCSITSEWHISPSTCLRLSASTSRRLRCGGRWATSMVRRRRCRTCFTPTRTGAISPRW